MKKNLSLLRRYVLTICLLFPLTISFALTYYISPTGNDVTGNGTIGNPWRTLFKATSTVVTAGNIIHINAGSYAETETSNLAPGVSIEGSGSATTIVKSDKTGNWSSFLQLQSNNGTNGNQTISNCTFDGQYVSETNNKTWMGIWITGRSNVIIHDCKIINFRDRGVIFAGNNAFNPLSDPGIYATGNKFYNNTVLNSAAGTGGYGAGLLNIGAQLGMEIYNNTMIQDQRANFKNGWPIKYWENGWLKGVKIYNNILKKAYYQGSYPGENGDWDFAIELFNIQGLEIYNNQIQGSIDLNYNYKGTYAFCTWIHHNTLDHAVRNTKFEAGIILEFATQSALIEDNIINNSSTGIQFNTRGPGNSGGYTFPPPIGGYSALTDNIIRRNLFSNIYTPSIGSSGVGIGIFSEGTDDPYVNNLYIYNNTIVALAGNAPWYGIDMSSQPNGNVNNVFIRNNIINNFNGAWIVGTNSAGNTNITGMTLTHNDAIGNGSNVPSWPGGDPANYTYNNNLSVDPRFLGGNNYTLQASSPVIDRGVNVGLPFSGNAPDMGYAEFAIGGPLPIKLVEFNVKENNGKNLLQWTTATENNSDYFNIERSSDARVYETIGRVNASGFSTTEKKYYFTDATPLKGINYYRLAMIDKDRTLEYSKIISITSEANHSLAITHVDMSSGGNTAIIRINSSQSQEADLSIIDMSGRTVLTTRVILQTGNNTITKTVSSLTNGIYYVRLLTKDNKVVKNAISRN